MWFGETEAFNSILLSLSLKFHGVHCLQETLTVFSQVDHAQQWVVDAAAAAVLIQCDLESKHLDWIDPKWPYFTYFSSGHFEFINRSL